MNRSLLVLVLLVCFQKVNAQVNIQNGVVACYPFTGNANDKSGNNNDGTVSGATLTTDRFGNTNSAYYFDGNSSISIPSAPIIANKNFTFSAWVFNPANPAFGDSETIISIGPANNNLHVGMTLVNNYSGSNTGWTVGGYNQTGTSSITTGATPQLSTWNHIVMTRDDTGDYMYINGILFGSSPNNGSPPYYYLNNSCIAYLGLRSNGSQPWTGAIDDVTIYGRALSGAEVLALYQNGIPCSDTPAVPSLQDGVVACYPFTGNAEDKSGNNNDGTVLGATLTADRFGNANSAYYFNGNSSISIPAGPIIANKNYTFSAWAYNPVNPPSGAAEAAISVGSPDDNLHVGITLINNYSGTNTGWTVGGYNQVGNSSFTTGILPATSQWYHVVMTRDDINVSMYINGVFVGSVATGGSPPSFYLDNTSVANIGLRSNGLQGWTGAIDDVSFYNRSLSANEVLVLYQKGLPCSDIPPVLSLQDGIVACYPFTGNADDKSGNNNNGSVLGATLTTDRFGNANSAYYFNGTNSISIPAAPIIANKNYTFSAWVFNPVNPSSGDSETIISVGPPFNNLHVGMTLIDNYSGSNTGWTVGGYNQSGTSSITTGVAPATSQWNHIVMTRDDSGVSMYINGVLFGSSPNGGSPPYYYLNNSCIAYLGLRSNGTQPWVGSIDDVSIYGRALSVSDVLSLYNLGLPCAPIIILAPTATDVSICGQGSAMLTAQGASGVTIFRWYDQQSGGTLLLEGNPYKTPKLQASTSYYVSDVLNGVESTRSKVTVNILNNPELSCNFLVEGDVLQSLNFSVVQTTGTPPFQYTFNYSDGTINSSSSTSQNHFFDIDGNYNVKATVIDGNGCTGECSGNVVINYKFFIPNVITVNGSDTLNGIFTAYTENNSKNYYRYNGTKFFNLTIFNRWGEEIFKTDEPETGWNGGNFPEGVYFYRILVGDEKFKGWVSLLR